MSDQTQSDPLLTRREIAARLRISLRTFIGWIQRGEFPPPLDLPGRVYRWPESVVNRWLADRIERELSGDNPNRKDNHQ